MAISWLIGTSVEFRLHLGRYSHHTPVLMGLPAPLAYPEFRLLKRQGGRCSWCGLYFKHGEDMVECDHIIPTSRGGDGTTTNLQLLHGHCHDVKTAKDQAVTGTPDKNRTTEEPCERKRTRTVLKPSQRERPR